MMVGWAGREVEAQWGGAGKSAGWKKRNGPRLRRKAGWAKSRGELFPNKIWIFEYTKALEICTRRFRRNFDMMIFSKFS
jgi:hypothetical protein